VPGWRGIGSGLSRKNAMEQTVKKPAKNNLSAAGFDVRGRET